MGKIILTPDRFRNLFYINIIPLGVVGFYLYQIKQLLSQADTIRDWFSNPILSSPGIQTIGLIFGIITILGAITSTLFKRMDLFFALCLLNLLFLFFVLQS